MRKNYNKLIRDKIPEIIAKTGKVFKVEIMNKEDYQKALLHKLVEEANEAQKADKNKLVIELVDLLEAIDSIMEEFEISETDVLNIKVERREERGGFKNRLRLLWTE